MIEILKSKDPDCTSHHQANAASSGWSKSFSPEESPWKHKMMNDGGESKKEEIINTDHLFTVYKS